MTISVLIADDHDANRSIVRRRLERRGYSVIEACDGREAVDMVCAHEPDVVLMDISMPVMDGLEAWRTITQTCPRPPVAIALTATVLSEIRSTCRDLGFSEFVEKPIEFDELVAVIQRLTTDPAQGRALP